VLLILDNPFERRVQRENMAFTSFALSSNHLFRMVYGAGFEPALPNPWFGALPN
jgi:hypothetical protein